MQLDQDHQQQFKDQIFTFMKSYMKEIDDSEIDYIGKHLNKFYLTFQQVQRSGGYIREYTNNPKFLLDQTTKVIRIYKKYFLSFEYYTQQKLTTFMDYMMIHKANHINLEDYYRGGQLNLGRNQTNVIHMENHVLKDLNKWFSLDAIRANHGHQKVDIRIQKSKDTGLMSKLPQDKLNLTISQYLEYQQDQQGFLRRLIKEGHTYLTLDSILFAVNVDMGKWIKEANTLRELFPEISFGSSQDGLAYLRQHTLGITMPQVYLTVADVYTGGHQEHLCVNAVNINNGPGSSVWISVDAEHVPRVRELILQESKLDIMVDEGLWFREAEYFIQHGIPVKCTVQKAGDIIVLGPGCLHLVKSEGITVQCAWNYMEKDLATVKAMYHRYSINQQLNNRCLIPLGSLFLDILNHEKLTLPKEVVTFIKEKLAGILEREKKLVGDYLNQFSTRIRFLEYKDTNQMVLLCSGCWHEIFMYYYKVEGNLQGGDYDFYCVECMGQQIAKVQEHSPQVINHKYKMFSLLHLLGNSQFFDCSADLCYSPYVGSVNCTLERDFIIPLPLRLPPRPVAIIKEEKQEQSQMVMPNPVLKCEPSQQGSRHIESPMISLSEMVQQKPQKAKPLRLVYAEEQTRKKPGRPRGSGRKKVENAGREKPIRIEDDPQVVEDDIPIKKKVKQDPWDE